MLKPESSRRSRASSAPYNGGIAQPQARPQRSSHIGGTHGASIQQPARLNGSECNQQLCGHTSPNVGGPSDLSRPGARMSVVQGVLGLQHPGVDVSRVQCG